MPFVPGIQNTIHTYLLRHTTNKTSYNKLRKSIQTIYKSFPSNFNTSTSTSTSTTNNNTIILQDNISQDNAISQDNISQDNNNNNNNNLLTDQEYEYIASSIIQKEYNFIAVMERFDESMVVLQMLLSNNNNNDSDSDSDSDSDNSSSNNNNGQVKLGDMLYLSSKQAGGYDDGQSINTCHKLQKSFITNTMTEYFKYENKVKYNQNQNNYISWKERTKWDHALWEAANRSLDLTIDNKFNKQLLIYKNALKQVQIHCSTKAIYPCMDGMDGKKPLSMRRTNCLYDDTGCGYKCIKLIAKKLQLLY
jgi:hypothetical protein